MNDTDRTITSLELGDSSLQIVYVEHSEADDRTGIITARTLVVPIAHLDDDTDPLSDIIDGINEIIDHALVTQRNPPTSFRRPR